MSAFASDCSARRRLRQLGDIRRDPPRLVAREQLGCRPAAGLILAIDEGPCLFIGLAHGEARPRRDQVIDGLIDRYRHSSGKGTRRYLPP
jgi:hypothetical protein